MGDGVPELVASGTKPSSTFERAGDRLRLAVELRPGETTIVSWRKLVREATSRKSNVPDPSASCSNPEVNKLPRPSPSIVATANEPNDSEAPPGSNRLANVIEKIERLYAGNGSSDDEDVVLDDVPDDDEYDTEDSFIDDAELDDYFKVDKSTIKHDGFFVNRGKLERIEPTVSVEQLPKKRRRKDGARDQGGDDRYNPIKQVKMGAKSRKALSLPERNSISQLPSVAASNASGISGKKKSTNAQTPTVPSGSSNTDGNRLDKGDDHRRNQDPSSPNHNNKQKQSSELRDPPSQRLVDRSVHGSKSDTGKQLSNVDEQNQTIQRTQKGGLAESFDLNVPATKDSMQMKTILMARKDGSNVKTRITMLEKSIRELEKTVAESRPPSTEIQDADNVSLQGIKRRLPADIKQKLAKVARLVHDSYRKIPKDVINRLMSIVGHLMQLRTLKRNLRVMANLGLSAKKEKDDRLQKIKLEIVEMVKERISHIESKAAQQKMKNDIQETSQEVNKDLKWKYSLDDLLENKICDLYDLYIERMEEHSGPPVKRLYEELAALWPNGVMDIDGIKRAIYKSKNRRKALAARRKDQNKIKKVLGAKVEGSSVRGVALPLSRTHEKLLSESSDGASPYTKSTVLAVPAQSQPAGRFSSDPNKQKDERTKGSSSGVNQTEALAKKKVKTKPNPETIEAQSLTCIEESKQQKHMAVIPLPKPTEQTNASEDPS